MTEDIRKHLEGHLQTLRKVVDSQVAQIEQLGKILVDAMKRGNKLLVMGNGGSAADAQHFAAEFVGRFLMERRGLPAVALTTNTSVLTAVGNDYGYDDVFRRQIEALAVQGDVVVGLSTSGNSPNVLRALEVAKSCGCSTVGLLGRDGGSIGKVVDLSLVIEEDYTPFIQEAHITIIHIICGLVEKSLFGRKVF